LDKREFSGIDTLQAAAAARNKPAQARPRKMVVGIKELSATPPRAAKVVMTVLIPFGCGYYLSYLFRTVNAVISPYLVSEFDLNPADLGFLTSIYFVTFAAMQVPLGVILDRYGPRRVQTALLLVAALGAAVFAMGDSLLAITIGRGLIGAGVASCLMSSFTANAIWWPRERLALMNNLIMTFGSIGALSATAPVHALLAVTDWRTLFAGLAVVTAVLAVVTFMVVPERKSATRSPAGFGAQFAALPRIFRRRAFWRYAAPFAVSYSIYMSYQTLWAAPWLRDVAGFNQAEVADYMLLIQLGMFLGVLLSGVLADRLRGHGIGPERIFPVAVALTILFQFFLVVTPSVSPGFLWTGYSLIASAIILGFTILTERFPPELTGRVITSCNLVAFVLAFAVQWGIGVIIGMFAGKPGGGYLPEAHSTALIVMLVFQLVAFLAYFLLRDPAETSVVDE
jgi:MFS family permease